MEEREKLAMSVLLEDFKACWQELLNHETDNSRASTLYVTAVVAVIAWMLKEEHFSGFENIFKQREKAVAFISLALVNTLFTLSMAFKGYRIQQIGLYIYAEIRPRINDLVGQQSLWWDHWRRTEFSKSKGSPELITSLYYMTVGALPATVTVLILGLYGHYYWKAAAWCSGENMYFYAVVLVVLVSLTLAIASTIGIARKWSRVIKATTSSDPATSPRPPSA